MIGTLNKQQIDHLLQCQVVGRLACYADDQLYIVPVTYAYDGEYIYGHTIEGKKINMMRKNPEICFEVDAIENLAHWRSAVVWGTFEELSGNEAEDAVQNIINRIQPLMTSETQRPRHSMDYSSGLQRNTRIVTYRIRIKQATGRYEKK